MNSTTSLTSQKGLVPPSLHWAIVLGLSVCTFGLFGLYWAFRQASFAKKLDPSTFATRLFATATALVLFRVLMQVVVAVTVARGGEATEMGPMGTVLWFFQVYFVVTGLQQIAKAITARYGVKLNTLFTIFGNVYYLQYHLTRIARANASTGGPGDVAGEKFATGMEAQA